MLFYVLHEDGDPSDPWNAGDDFADYLGLGDSWWVVVVPGVQAGLGCLWPGVSVSVAFGAEVEDAVPVCYTDYSVHNELAGVEGVVEDDYVAVGVVGVEGCGVYSLDDYDVAYVECSGEGVAPSVACSVVGDAHASAYNRECRWDFGI